MKRFLLLTAIFTSGLTCAQIPQGYYDNATGTGYVLKTQLFNIIKGHTDKGYNNLYNCYKNSDRDNFYENDGTLLDIYSEKPSGTDAYNFSLTASGERCGNYASEGDCFNREHLMPQSIFGERAPMKADAHHVIPTDGKVNGQRSNYAFGKVGNATWTSTNGSKLGSNLNSGYSAGYSGIVFEPIDEFKGDVARALLYFATRYEDKMASYSHAMLNRTKNECFSPWFKNVLLTWHAQDPVSQREIVRNNAVYNFQGNRNPYVDHPEYVEMIWGAIAGTSGFEATANISVYPNPAIGNMVNIYCEAAVDDIQLISINGQIVKHIVSPRFSSNTYTLTDLSQGFYFLKVAGRDGSMTKKIIVN